MNKLVTFLIIAMWSAIALSPLSAGLLLRGAIVTPLVWAGWIDAETADEFIFMWSQT